MSHDDVIEPTEVSEIVDRLLADFGIPVVEEAPAPKKVDSMSRPSGSWMNNIGRRKAG